MWKTTTYCVTRMFLPLRKLLSQETWVGSHGQNSCDLQILRGLKVSPSHTQLPFKAEALSESPLASIILFLCSSLKVMIAAILCSLGSVPLVQWTRTEGSQTRDTFFSKIRKHTVTEAFFRSLHQDYRLLLRKSHRFHSSHICNLRTSLLCHFPWEKSL